MAAPKNEVVQMEYQNPHASKPLYVPVLVVSNTSDQELERNIRINSKRDLSWLKSIPAHDGVAVMVGGGPSVEEYIDEIKELQNKGATIFAMNAASQWCHRHGIKVDLQCIIDAKEETASLMDREAEGHLIGSQVHPKTMESVELPLVCHLEIGEVERFFPEVRKKKGGYVLLGGGAAVGNTALCAAYAAGYRVFHVFGYDSCHKDGKSHAYPQDMNLFIPTVDVEWAGKKFTASVAMKAQAERFQYTSKALKQKGCEITVYGDGLLQTMYSSKPSDLSEKEKYQLMWEFDTYRENSPGEQVVDLFTRVVQPDGLIIDFGCGTGRAGVKLAGLGHDVILVDFTDNCRDEEALSLPFMQCDLTEGCLLMSPYGLCTDVMEHIPTQDIDKAIKNIMWSAENVFFQISTVHDEMGAAIDSELHLTVKPHSWWKDRFKDYVIEWECEQDTASLFYIRRNYVSR